MNINDDWKDEVMRIVLMVVFATALVLLLSSCKTKYVAVPEVRTEYQLKVDTILRHDSIYMKDSSTYEIKGDTVYLKSYKTRLVYRDRYRVKIDTVRTVDSVSVPYPVERELSVREKMRINTYPFLLVLLAASICMIMFLAKRGKD